MSEKDFNFDAFKRFQVYQKQRRNRSSLWRSSLKKMFLKCLQNSQETLVPGSQTCKFIKSETLAQVSSREFREILKNTIIYTKTSGRLLLEV